MIDPELLADTRRLKARLQMERNSAERILPDSRGKLGVYLTRDEIELAHTAVCSYLSALERVEL